MKKKTIALICAAVLICAGVIGGTIAWLTDSKDATNTFSVGNIDISLSGATADITKIIPGETISMSPVVTIAPNSESCWVFVEVDNGLVLNDTAKTLVGTLNINTANWIAVTTSGTKTVYAYKDSAATEATKVDVPKALPAVFTTITIDGDKVTKANIADLSGKTVAVYAYAHQSAHQSFATASTAALTHFGV